MWLVSVFFRRHTALGLVKVLCSRATMDLQQVLARTVEKSKLRPRLKDVGLDIVANDTIDLIFRDTLEK